MWLSITINCNLSRITINIKIKKGKEEAGDIIWITSLDKVGRRS